MASQFSQSVSARLSETLSESGAWSGETPGVDLWPLHLYPHNYLHVHVHVPTGTCHTHSTWDFSSEHACVLFEVLSKIFRTEKISIQKKSQSAKCFLFLYDTPVITYLGRSHRNSVHTTFMSSSSAGREVLSWITKWNYFHLVPALRESNHMLSSLTLKHNLALPPGSSGRPHRERHSDSPDLEVDDSPYTWEEANAVVLHPGKATVAKGELGKASCHVQDHTRAPFRLYKEWA